MRTYLHYIVLALSLFGGVFVNAKTKRVLAICDPVQQQIVQEAARELKGKVGLVVPRGLKSFHSDAILDELDRIIGKQEWDVIYFNFGIADLIHRDPKTKAMRLMNKDAGGRPTSLKNYQQNLDKVLQRLKQTKAKLIWGSTTPLVNVHFFPTFEGGLFKAGSEVEYNEAAKKLMQRHSVQVVDLHAFILKHIPKGGNTRDARRGISAARSDRPGHGDRAIRHRHTRCASVGERSRRFTPRFHTPRCHVDAAKLDRSAARQCRQRRLFS